MAGEGLTPEQIADLSVRRRQINERHGLGQAQQDYLTGAAQGESARQLGQLTTDYTRMAEKLPWAFARRGLLNSGIRQTATIRSAQDFTTNKANLAGRLNDTLGGYRLAKDQMTSVKAGALGDINLLEQAAISSKRAADVAESIRSAG